MRLQIQQFRITLASAIGTPLFLLALLLSTPGFGQDVVAPPPAPAAIVDNARKEMDLVQSALSKEVDSAQLQEARQRALATQAQLEVAAEAISTQLAQVQARLAELGTPAAGTKEAPDIASQRAELVRSQTALDSQVKLAGLLAVEAEQAVTTIATRRRTQFSAHLFERTDSPLSTAFWSNVGSDAPADISRVRQLGSTILARMSTVAKSVWLLTFLACAVLVVASGPGGRVLLRIISTRIPAGRLRRSLYALGVVGVWTVVPGVAAHVLFTVLTSGASGVPISDELRALLGGLDAIVWFGGFCVGLGVALLMPAKPTWRLLPIADRTAWRLRWFPLAFAITMVVEGISTRLSVAAELSLTATVILKGLAALTHSLLIVAALVQFRRTALDSASPDHPSESDPAATVETTPVVLAIPLWLQSLRSFTLLILLLTLFGFIAGYIAMASFLLNQLSWIFIVASAAYLLTIVTDDLFMTLLAPKVQPPEQLDKTTPGQTATAAPPPRTLELTAVLLSGASRILITLLALVLLVAPFGESPLELLHRASNVNEGLSIGEISIRPATVFQGLLVLCIGLFLVRMLKRWIGSRLMPTTRLDDGMRMSLTTLSGYLGVILVIALSMSAVGVGLERVAWVASALSVGIGFGLQGVVQNFVSGLILLAERPVKVGDWVSLSGVEGDIRRINVRATEIQMADRSTVIVPNSEFITKIVRNVTYTNPIGMVQIKLPMPLDTDTLKARAVILEAFDNHAGVLASPAASVQLDGIDGLRLVFNACGYVSSPRASYGVKSDLLFDILTRLKEAGLSLSLPPTIVMSNSTEVPAVPSAVRLNNPETDIDNRKKTS
ncbi:DUF3772 domain-containing protein [Actimicrobium sp. CCC2.4]|uniref:DUF3772 domain-containing protein n=1 Tax=Actimicrobium sp. CCC2.4 TaxID=3048606 RepID=UPI002AC8AB89|nr:DUF3772 domain-containing protein [Actimicrobium sp. CCC2.4]MEB0134893.1 DUF3772 domain-containing protein [Actimicrobium sp. CCC2.4]WPX32055.1 DUF3772 domain-containing protein [Actimicrobium sp. CCC2.4]